MSLSFHFLFLIMFKLVPKLPGCQFRVDNSMPHLNSPSFRSPAAPSSTPDIGSQGESVSMGLKVNIDKINN